MKSFDRLVVVEIAGSLAGGYCAKLFADHGAEVILVGRGDMTSDQMVYIDAAKSVVDGLPAGLLDRADVVIQSSATGPIESIDGLSDGIVSVQISPYGSTGPYSPWRGSDLTDYAIGGHLYLYGDPTREPIRPPPDQPRYASGLFGFIGAMAALFGREATGSGQVVEVAHTEVMLALHQFTMLRQFLGHDTLRRMGNRFTGQGQPNSIYPCADGWVCVSAPSADQVERLLDVTELSHLLDREDITSPLDFQLLPSVLDDALMPWLAERDSADIVELFQAVRVPAAPVSTMESLLADPHLATRDYWRRCIVGDAEFVVPGPPFRMSGHRWRGQHTAATAEPAEVGVEESRSPSRSGNASATGSGPSFLSGAGEGTAPLSGLRVLDLTRVWAGPLATRIMAALGADVVWVEAPWGRGPQRMPESMVETVKYYPNNDQGDRQWNRNGHLIKFSLGKRSLALDMATEAGTAAFERLVPWADVVIENFSSRVMPQFGFDEHRLHELNPSLVYVTMPGYGRSGPAEHWLAFGSSVDSHAGLSSLVGYPEQRPWKGGIAWPDPIAGLHATSATLIALWDRAVDPLGRGQTVESAQFEATVAVVGDQLVATQRGRSLVGSSNRSDDRAPQGVYRCDGEDRWLAIAVADDAEWETLCTVAEFQPELARIGLEARLARHDELDELIAAWTGTRSSTTVRS